MNDLDLGIKKIGQPTAAGQHGRQKPGEKKKRPQQSASPAESMNDLTQAVESANKMLAAKKSPYHFRICREHADVCIDLVVADNRGDAMQIIRRNIPPHDFLRIIDHLETLDGVLVDFEA